MQNTYTGILHYYSCSPAYIPDFHRAVTIDICSAAVFLVRVWNCKCGRRCPLCGRNGLTGYSLARCPNVRPASLITRYLGPSWFFIASYNCDANSLMLRSNLFFAGSQREPNVRNTDLSAVHTECKVRIVMPARNAFHFG
jgi:hypothetical protein